MSLLTVDGLSKEFGGVHAVEDLSFEVDEGEIHSIIGPNGAGKTTLLNLITGIYWPTAGTIRFDGQDVTRWAPHSLAASGMSRTFQNLQIFFNMSALENVMVARHRHLNAGILQALLRVGGIGASEARCRDKAAELLEFVGLSGYVDARADSMPYGALKRLEIARALATEPKLLLLDEPAAGLNRVETKEIDELIRKVSESGVTVILVEHDMRLVMAVSDHILVLDYGRKLAEGSAGEVRTNPEVVAAYLGVQATSDD